MVKLVEATRKKNIPFSFLVGDLPTYKTIVQLKVENSEMYKDLIPIIGAFHQQMSYSLQLLRIHETTAALWTWG